MNYTFAKTVVCTCALAFGSVCFTHSDRTAAKRAATALETVWSMNDALGATNVSSPVAVVGGLKFVEVVNGAYRYGKAMSRLKSENELYSWGQVEEYPRENHDLTPYLYFNKKFNL